MNNKDIFGYEDLCLEQLSNSLTEEKLNNKKLILISAPIDFDEKLLVGQAFIPNSSSLLKNNENDGRSWEIKTSNLKQELTMLIPSAQNKQMVLSKNPIEHNISLIETIHVPSINYPIIPSEEKVIEKPCDLRTRWKPFGVGNFQQHNNIKKRSKDKQEAEDLIEISSFKKKKKKKKKENVDNIQNNNSNNNTMVTPFKNKNIKETVSLNSEVSETKSKKKHKKSKDIVESSPNKTKSKHKRKHQDDAEEIVIVKKKKKKHS